MSGKKVPSADNQQETLYYFSGFLAGEGSISVIKANNTKGRSGYYYTPDITISNADKNLLEEMNRIIGKSKGVITRIKGGFNLSFRGKEKVENVVTFLDHFPPLYGRRIREKLDLLKQAILILRKKEKQPKRLPREGERIEKIRLRLKILKKGVIPRNIRSFSKVKRAAIGYFLSGIVDAEGSMGLRKVGKRLQPFFAVAMREEQIIKKLKTFLSFGNIYYRPKNLLWHYETAKQEKVLRLCKIFLEKYPVKLMKNVNRLKELERILNDYTPDRLFFRRKRRMI